MSNLSPITEELRLAVMSMVEEGHSTKEIAHALGESIMRISAIKAHITRGSYSGQTKSAAETSKASAAQTTVLKNVAESVPSKQPVSPQSTFEQTAPNQGTLIYTDTKIPKSLDELLAWCNVDKSVWRVQHHTVNMWTVTMKKVVAGKEPTTMTAPNWQIKAFLVRREATEVKFPVIQPIVLKGPTFESKKAVQTKRVKTALLFGDTQMGYRKNQQTNDLQPFHDRKCLDVLVQINAYLKPDTRIYLGDMLDFAGWSDKFKKEQEFYFTTEPALKEMSWWLQRFESIPATESHWIEGNHEGRMAIMVLKHMIEARGLSKVDLLHPELPNPELLSVPGLLPLDQLGVTYHGNYPHGEVWLNDNVRAAHGSTVRKGSGKSVQAILEEARNTEICGHTHRLESCYKTVHPRKGPVTYGVFSMGTTARIDDAVPAQSTRQNWQQGFGVVHYTDDGWFHVDQYSINNGTVLFDGQIFTANNQKDLIQALSKDTGTDFNRQH